MDTLNALTAFAALSQQARLDAFRALIKAGTKGMGAGEISTALNVRQNTMSANLLVLRNAGLIRNERHGRTIQYFAKVDALRGLLSFLMEDCCGGDASLCNSVLDEIVCLD